MVGIVVFVLAGAGGAGFLFLKQTDPGAGHDRDRLVAALPTPATFSGSYSVANVESFAANRAGLRLAGAPEGPGCDEMNSLTTAHGTAGATEEAAASDDTDSFSFLAYAYATDAYATDAFALAAGDAFRQCFQAGITSAAGAETMQLADAPVPLPAPALGDEASAYRLDMTVSAGADIPSFAVPIQVVVFRSGRSVVMAIAVGRPDQPFPDENLAAATAYLAAGVAELS